MLDEAVSLLSRQAGADYAVRWGREHLASREIEWLNTTPADWQEALLWLDKFADQKLGSTDCVSSALMRRESIQQAFSFDHYFELAGFERWPK